MGDYQIGYKKPPRHAQFKKGVCANPNGRGRRKALEAGRIYDSVINALAEIPQGGKIARLPRMELLARRNAAAAVKGSVRSAEELLDMLIYSERHGDFEVTVVELPPEEFFARPPKEL